MSFDDDNDFGDDGSSEEEQNEQDEAADEQDENDGDEGDQDDEDDGDGDEDDDGDNGDGDGDGDDTEMQDVGPSSRSTDEKKPGQLTMPSNDAKDPLKLNPSQRSDGEQQDSSEQKEEKDPTTIVDYTTVRPEALTAATFDIVPTIAAPHSTSINCVTATPNMKYVFSGGSDGYIRKFNWPDTANGKLMLTVAQRHPFVDSVTKAGVLMSYWENEEGGGKPENLSPVYSLAVNQSALWLLSGLESGGINLQSVRHEEGKLIHRLKEHTSAVSVLQLAPDERSALSGSWDRRIFDWDLDTGQVIRRYEGSSSQISAVEMRPESSLPVPKAEEPARLPNGTFSSNNAQKAAPQSLANGTGPGEGVAGDMLQGQPSPAPSHHSFSSLFGDNDDDNAMDTSFGNTAGDGDNDLFGGAVTTDMRPGEEPTADGGMDITMTDAPMPEADNSRAETGANGNAAGSDAADAAAAPSSPTKAVNGSLSHEADAAGSNATVSDLTTQSSATLPGDGPSSHSNNTFLSASIDGSIRIWDRRMSASAVKLPSRFAPPWCMSAVWSPDGNFFYAGRRNGTVEEYSLHKPLAAPSRTFRFPSGSGPVSALKAMPNGRHLVCASFDILRLYDLQHDDKTAAAAAAGGASAAMGKTPFLIVPGHRTGVVSSLFLDSKCSFMISTAGNRGWEGTSTQVLLGYEIGI